MVLMILCGLGLAGAGFFLLRSRSQSYPVMTWSGSISSPAPAQHEPEPQPVVTAASSTQPSDILSDLNRHWLDRINALRLEKSLRALRTDGRLVVTASEWAGEMQRRSEITHERLDGKTMHQWIDAKQLDFAERGSAEGWKVNYFVENIARAYSEPSNEAMKESLDRILDDFLSEGPGGAHYESIYHQDWNSVGLGFSYTSSSEETVRVYFAFHYGSLE